MAIEVCCWYQFVLCSDILSYMDKQCSGRTSCDVPVWGLVILTNPCTSEVRSYLQASFTCISGEFALYLLITKIMIEYQIEQLWNNIDILEIIPDLYHITYFSVIDYGSNCCQLPNDRVHVTAGSGYLASVETLDTGCGNRDCPWLLEALEGQRINISIYDFGLCKYSLSIE